MSKEEIPYFVCNIIYRIVFCLLVSTGFAYYVCDFLQKRRHAYIAGIVYLFVLLIFEGIPWHISNFFPYLFSALAGLIVIYYLERQFIRQKLFLAISFFSIRALSADIGNYFYILIYWASQKSLTLMLNEKRQFLVFVGNTVFFIILFMGVLFFFLRLCKKSYRIKNQEMSVREFIILVTPCVAFIMGRQILTYYYYFYEEQMHQIGQRPYDFLGLLYNLVALFTIVMVIIQSQKIKMQAEEQKCKEILEHQLYNMHSHIDEVERLYEEIRGLKHDMGNHIETIRGLWENGAVSEVKGYSERLMEVYQSSVRVIKTGHPVTDVLLAEKEKTINRLAISFQNDFHFPVGMEVDVFDISILLNNALDNAIEACNRVLSDNHEGIGPVFIRLASCQKEHIFLLELTNSCKEGTMEYQDTQLLKSTKKEIGHGYGLANMRMVAEKYMGTLECKQLEDTFSLVIMLQG